MDEEALVRDAVRRMRDGDAGALEYLYVRFAGDVHRHVARVVGDQSEADDVTQNVFARLPSSIRRYEERDSQFGSWLLAVARNAALDEMRKRRPEPSEHAASQLSETDELVRADAIEALTETLAALPEDQRTVLLLRHLAGLSPGEIALRLGRSTDAVHCLHRRGRRAARAKLTRLGAAPATSSE